MKIYSKSDIGLLRKSNQDAVISGSFNDDSGWALVCDGMGGENGGNIASDIAVKEISKFFKDFDIENSDEKKITDLFDKSINVANEIIYNKAQEEKSLKGMGTTFVLTLVVNGVLYIAHAGDSRAYLINKEKVSQITVDHSIVQEMIKLGEITKEEAETHPRKNVITRALGVDPEIEFDYKKIKINKDDRILLCTDGLTNYLNSEKIYEISVKLEGKNLVEELILEAKNLGGNDNITVVIIDQ